MGPAASDTITSGTRPELSYVRNGGVHAQGGPERRCKASITQREVTPKPSAPPGVGAWKSDRERKRAIEPLLALRVDFGTSASLIGRLRSSTFRLSTTAVSMSLTSSRFSSESAPGPFHHGIR